MSDRVDIVHGGTAIRIGAPGSGRLIRRKDLDFILGSAGPADRIASARLGAGALDVELVSGVAQRIELESLSPRSPSPELVLDDARVMTCDGTGEGESRLGIIERGAVVVGQGRILWVGPRSELGQSGLDLDGVSTIPGDGRLLSPGLIDCHAHPLYAGDRAAEFAMRAAGDDYRSIAERGGGIAATLGPTRAATIDEHIELCWQRMQRAFAAGTTTCEAKSGYDLTVEGELRLLEVANAVDALSPVDLSPTLLGAHVIPPERRGDRGRYVTEVSEAMIPRAASARLATAVDVYCDEGAFTRDESERILRAGRAAGLLVRAHVGQFADLGGAELVAELGGRSADHLEEVSDAGIEALAAADVVAVMLPGACVQLRQTPPPVARLRRAGVAMAVATDMNPGSINCEVLPIPMWLAATHYGMTVDEVWLGVTRHAARALGRHDVGILEVGARADLVLWNCELPAAIPYRVGRNLVAGVIKAGRCHHFTT